MVDCIEIHKSLILLYTLLKIPSKIILNKRKCYSYCRYCIYVYIKH